MSDNGTSRTQRIDAALDDRQNNLIAAGAVFALLAGHADESALTAVDIVTDAEGVTNQIEIGLSFMASPYRITVERVTDGDDQ